LATFNSFVNARYSDISVDCNDFDDAGFLITYRKIEFYTAKINDIWAKNEINDNNNCNLMETTYIFRPHSLIIRTMYASCPYHNIRADT
jgi:hypothetical protein